MGQLLKIAGVIFLGWKLFGDNVTSAILEGIHYEFSSLRNQGIRTRLVNEQLVGLIRIELLFKQSLGLNLFTQQLSLQLSQQGQHLGKVEVNVPVTLPNATTVSIPFDVVVASGNFLDRLEKVLVDPNARYQAPIDIRGTLTLSNGLVVPVFTSLDFMNL